MFNFPEGFAPTGGAAAPSASKSLSSSSNVLGAVNFSGSDNTIFYIVGAVFVLTLLLQHKKR